MTISIRSNVAALNARNQISKTTQSQAKAMTHLASGSRLSSASDDAAALQLSTRLSSQSRGLDRAVQNAHNGISVIQTADGAMSETNDLLQQMRTLALQAANGVNNDDDRDALQGEISALNKEMNHIAESTTFGGDQLLNGRYGTKSFQIGTDSGSAVNLTLKNMRSDAAMMGGKNFQAQKETNHNWEVPKNRTQLNITFNSGDSSEASSINITAKAGDDIEQLATYINGQTDKKVIASVNEHGQLQLFSGNSLHNGNVEIDGSLAEELDIQPQATSTVDDIDVSTVGGAQQAVGVIDAALKYVGNSRSDAGALQNRFDHTISNLNTVNQNITASNGRLRDTDFAKEATQLTQSQIRSQASSAVLAQAKQLPQTALNLLG